MLCPLTGGSNQHLIAETANQGKQFTGTGVVFPKETANRNSGLERQLKTQTLNLTNPHTWQHEVKWCFR